MNQPCCAHGRDERLHTRVPDYEGAKDHVVHTTTALARRPFTKEEGVLDIMVGGGVQVEIA